MINQIEEGSSQTKTNGVFSSTSTINNQSAQLIDNNQNNKESMVILLVEKDLADPLKSELDVYSQDILKEYNFHTIIKLVQQTDDILTLQKYVLDTYKSGDLSGILIVGNVPTGLLYHPDIIDTNSVFNSQGLILSDSVYQDILGACIYSPDKKAFSYKDPRCQTGNTIPPYWIGRLTPNSSTEDSLTLLKEYFRRNHDYRTGEFSYQKKVLIYTPIFSDSKPSEKQGDIASIKDFSMFNEYSSDQINYIDSWDTNSDQTYLSELHKPHQYEFVFFNGHGAPTFHQKNLKAQDINNMSAFLVFLGSCSVGRFTTQDYLAGQYLFSDGLVVMTASVPVFVVSQAPKNLSYPLTAGLPVFKALRVAPITNAMNILGDTTLRMRYKNVTRDQSPIIKIDQNEMTFSDFRQDAVLKIKNDGNTKLFFKTMRQFDTQNNLTDKILSSFSVMINPPITSWSDSDYFIIDSHTEATIKPIIFPWDEIPQGSFTGSLFVFSNDKTNPFIEIPFEIQKE
jgi:hypothetical protein